MRIIAWLAGILGAVVLLLGLLWFGYGLYVRLVVVASPATVALIKTDEGELRLGEYRGGNQVLPAAAAQPAGLAERVDRDSGPRPDATPSAEAGGAAGTPEAMAQRANRPILPPTRLRIAKIAVDAPVVLADNDNLPKFKGVGWYIGSGYPGFRGNVVLFGHLNGEFETFGRLDELRPGDVVAVQAMERSFSYTVVESKVVPKDTVAVMAPSRDARLTLITCTGTFYPDTLDYSHRLVVVGALVPE